MASIGFPPPTARFPILSETARPVAVRPASPRVGDVPPGERPERPDRPDHPHRTDRPARPDRPERPDRPGDISHRERAHLAQATRRFVHEAKAIIKNGGTMEDIKALTKKILEEIPALEKFPPFQKIMKRIAHNLRNESGGPTPVESGSLKRAEAVATLTRRDLVDGPVAKNPVVPTGLSIIV